jgi:hypothetical protein
VRPTTASWDKAARVWSAATGQVLAMRDTTPRVEPGSAGSRESAEKHERLSKSARGLVIAVNGVGTRLEVT